MRDLLDAFTPYSGLDYGVGKVVSVDTALGTVAIDWRGGRYSAVPYLLSYTPAVNDKVQVISGESIGALVLGKTTFVPALAAGTTRTDFVQPSSSMNWSENVTNHQNGVAETVGVDEDASEIDVNVKQGSKDVRIFSGAYLYPVNTIVLGPSETLIKAEILIKRVDEGAPMTVSPSLTELISFRTDGKPIVDHPERAFSAPDMLPDDVFWVAIPLDWAKNILDHSTMGIVFSATSAQLSLTYSEYSAATSVAESDSGTVGGTIQLTIENRVLS